MQNKNYNRGVFTVIRGCKNERNREKETYWASARPRALLGLKSNRTSLIQVNQTGSVQRINRGGELVFLHFAQTFLSLLSS